MYMDIIAWTTTECFPRISLCTVHVLSHDQADPKYQEISRSEKYKIVSLETWISNNLETPWSCTNR